MTQHIAPTAEISPQMKWSLFDPDNDHFWEFGYISNDVFGEIDADMPQVFPVTKFGAMGDGQTDDTAAFQAAIDAAAATVDTNTGQNHGGAIIWLPPRQDHYLIKGALTIRNNGRSYIKIMGTGASYIRGTGDSDDPVITIARNGSNPIPGHIILDNVTIAGSDQWDGSTTTDRIGIKINQAQDLIFRDVWICNFAGGALDCTDLWDSHFYNLSISRCGHSISDSNYAYAVSLKGATDQCNGNQFFGGMWQYNPLTLYVDDNSRSNTWSGMKFENRSTENGDGYPADSSKYPAFWFKQGIENGMVNCFFALDYHNRGKYFFQVDENKSQYVQTAGLLPYLTVSSCQFTAPIGMTAQWFKGAYTIVSNSVFNRTDGIADTFPFHLLNGAKFINNEVSFGNENRNCFMINGDNVIIQGNTLYQGFDIPASGGAVYALNGSFDGIIVADNYLRGNFDTYFLYYADPPSGNQWLGKGRWTAPVPLEATWSDESNPTPSAFMTHFVSVSYDDSATELTYFNNGYSGQRLVLRFNHSAKLKHNLNKIWLKGLADRTPDSGEVVEFLCTTDGVWMEM